MRFLVLALAVLLSGCATAPPHGKVEIAYFECPESRTLEGGIYGKDMVRHFGPDPGLCQSSDWVRITRAQFKDLATAWYGVDWSKEGPWWQRSGGEEVLPQ
jgi:hypothetical protein